MTDLAGLYAIIGLQFLGLLVTTWHCDILSRRIDSVHKRITVNNQINGLKSGAWDRATLSSMNAEALMWFRLRGDARLGRCASEHCGGQPMWRLEADGVGSDYCSGCRQKIEPSRCTCQFRKDDYGAPQIIICETCALTPAKRGGQ